MKPRQIIGLVALVVLCIGGVAMVVAKYGPSSEDAQKRVSELKARAVAQKQEEQQHEQQFRQRCRQVVADKVVNNIQHMKDPRTGLCYAYYWNGSFRNSGTITLIPESAVPPDMLIVANMEGKK